MHSFHGKTVNFFYHGDFKGELHILDKETGQEVKMDMEDLMNFIQHMQEELEEEMLNSMKEHKIVYIYDTKDYFIKENGKWYLVTMEDGKVINKELIVDEVDKIELAYNLGTEIYLSDVFPL